MNGFCEVCGVADMVLGDSSLYCRNCGAQSNQYLEEAFDAEDAHLFNTTFVRERGTLRNAEHQQQQQPQSQPLGSAPDENLDGLDGLDSLADLFGRSQEREAPLELTPEIFNGSAPFSVKIEDLSQPRSSQYGQGSQIDPEFDPTSRMFKDELARSIRKSYLNGLQKILQLQLECLVKEFNVTPLICGIAGPIWLKFVASTRVFEKAWAEEAVMVADYREKIRRESRPRVSSAEVASTEDAPGEKQKKRRVRELGYRKNRPGPRTSFGRHLSFVWLSALKERIPLSMTLVISFLSCYIAREPILPTDIRSWAISGQLPYLAAFVEISNSAPHHIPNTVGEKQIFPMKPRIMFQPVRVLGARFLEFLAGFVAERVGIQLPPVNFHAICARFLRDLGLSVEKLFPYVCRLYEWYTPAGLFLSGRRKRKVYPARVYVMAMLVITLKVLYNLDGRWKMETDSHRRKGKSDTSSQNDVNGVVTRAKAKQQASAEPFFDKEHSSNPVNTSHGTQTGPTTSGKDRSSNLKNTSHGTLMDPTSSGKGRYSVAEGEVSRKRKRLQPTSSKDRGGQDHGEVCISGKRSGSKPPIEGARSREPQKELGDTKELLEKLESSKMTVPVDFDEELSRYLKYCQNVLFAGHDCDAGMEPVLERFWGIYEKNVQKIEEQPVVSLGEEAAPSGGSGRKPTPKRRANGSLNRAENLESDAPSAGSTMRPDAINQKTKQAGRGEVLHTETDDAPLEREFTKESTELRVTSNLIADMKKSGFSCLPPLEGDLGWDEYMRYNFQDSGKDLVPVHEYYFRVLRACGKLISVHSKSLHRCVQKIEKGLLQVESNIEQFLLEETDVDLVELAKAVKRRKPRRRRDKVALAENAKARAEMTQHVKVLDYL